MHMLTHSITSYTGYNINLSRCHKDLDFLPRFWHYCTYLLQSSTGMNIFDTVHCNVSIAHVAVFSVNLDNAKLDYYFRK